jgi:hypothetical protein
MLDISPEGNSSACKKHGCFHKIFVDGVAHFLDLCHKDDSRFGKKSQVGLKK